MRGQCYYYYTHFVHCKGLASWMAGWDVNWGHGTPQLVLFTAAPPSPSGHCPHPTDNWHPKVYQDRRCWQWATLYADVATLFQMPFMHLPYRLLAPPQMEVAVGLVPFCRVTQDSQNLFLAWHTLSGWRRSHQDTVCVNRAPNGAVSFNVMFKCPWSEVQL